MGRDRLSDVNSDCSLCILVAVFFHFSRIYFSVKRQKTSPIEISSSLFLASVEFSRLFLERRIGGHVTTPIATVRLAYGQKMPPSSETAVLVCLCARFIAVQSQLSTADLRPAGPVDWPRLARLAGRPASRPKRPEPSVLVSGGHADGLFWRPEQQGTSAMTTVCQSRGRTR